MLDGLLVGIIFCAALAISLFFLNFWRATRDQLFLAFALVFAIEGVTRLSVLVLSLPNERAPFINLMRLIGYIVLIASIAGKNRGSPTK